MHAGVIVNSIKVCTNSKGFIQSSFALYASQMRAPPNHEYLRGEALHCCIDSCHLVQVLVLGRMDEARPSQATVS